VASGSFRRSFVPQCPICNSAVWVDERYCVTCYNYIPHLEEKDHFCPQCSIRVAPQQEICHKCKAVLPKIAGTSPLAPTGAWRHLFRIPGIFVGTGLVFVALLLVILLKKSHRPFQLALTPPPQAASKQTHDAPPIPTAEKVPAAPTTPAAQKFIIISEPTTSSPPKETTPKPSFPIYIVNVEGLALRDGPNMSAPQIATLNLNDEVELLETSGGWGKVRDVRRNIIGWSYMRYLAPNGG
jgi:hypothetical protein